MPLGKNLELGLARGRGLAYTIFSHADMAQLVEHHLAKVGVAGSNPVVRSMHVQGRPLGWPFLHGDVAKW